MESRRSNSYDIKLTLRKIIQGFLCLLLSFLQGRYILIFLVLSQTLSLILYLSTSLLLVLAADLIRV
jgi:hypothetical protein